MTPLVSRLRTGRPETTQRLLKQNIGHEINSFWWAQIRSRTPEAVGRTGAGLAPRGMQGESFPLPAGGIFRVVQ
jgi:hypothetical protein